MEDIKLTTQLSDITDEEVAKRVQDGETQLFGILVQRYEGRLRAYARRFLRRTEDGEDVIQEVFIKAYRNIQSFDSERKFSSWIYRIAHNELVNDYKKRLRDLVDFFDFDTFLPAIKHHDTSPRIDDQLDTEAMRKSLESCLSKLAAKYRQPLALYYFEEMEYKEIAEILHLPISTVGVRINRGKLQLRKICGNIPRN